MRNTLFLLIALLSSTIYAKAQGNSFKNTAAVSNKEWRVTKYTNVSAQTDKKDAFKNYSFQFNLNDPASVLDPTSITIRDTRNANRPTYKGVWDELPDNTVRLTLPLIPHDKDFSQIASLLNNLSLEKVSITPVSISLKGQDSTGQVAIEFGFN